MPPEEYKKVYSNKNVTIEKGVHYGFTRIFVNGKYYWNIKLLNTEPAYLDNLIYNIKQIIENIEEGNYKKGYEKGYNDAKQEIRNFLEIKE